MEILPNIFNSNDIFFPEFKNDCNYNKIFDLLISNIKKSQLSEYLTKELIINFSPIIFEFIHLDDNLFDWIEKIIDKKCIFCSKIVNDYLICLICEKRICYTKICNKYYEHVKNCCGDTCIFIRMNNMKAYIFTSNKNIKTWLPLYVNENGVGPSGIIIGNEYKLSQEQIKIAIKNYACNDFYFD